MIYIQKLSTHASAGFDKAEKRTDPHNSYMKKYLYRKRRFFLTFAIGYIIIYDRNKGE